MYTSSLLESNCLDYAVLGNRATLALMHALVLEIGPAGEWPSKEKPNFGGSFAVDPP
jgi:hypothetical protein